MATRAQVIQAARECLGTPFRHQGRKPGIGLDCVGLVRWPAVVLGLVPPTADYLTYARSPDPYVMREQLTKYAREIPPNEARPGDILWLRIYRDPTHLAILTFDHTIIHAVSDGPRCVVEHGFRAPWPSRVVAAFQYPGLED